MRKTKFINRESLTELYDGIFIPLMGDSTRLSNASIYRTAEILSEKFEVRELRGNNFSDYTKLHLYEIIGRANSDYRFMLGLPSWVIDGELPDTLDVIQSVLDQLMPGRYYIQKDVTHFRLYLHYPEITIKNSTGQEHKIHDLVIRLHLGYNNNFYVSDIQGKRFAWTQRELNKRYHHSHLSTDIGTEFGTFCLGGGSNFKNLIAKISNNITSNSFALFLIQLEQYLAWESLEGKPYTTIAGLGSTEVVNPTNTLNSDTINILSRRFLDLIDESFLIKIGNSYRVNPGLYPHKMLEIEKQLASLLSSRSVHDFDLISNTYISNSSNSRALPSTSNILDAYGDVAGAFSIFPRLVTATENTDGNTQIIKRLSSATFNQVLEKVNELLQDSSKIELNEENSVTAESESDDSSPVSSTSGVFA